MIILMDDNDDDDDNADYVGLRGVHTAYDVVRRRMQCERPFMLMFWQTGSRASSFLMLHKLVESYIDDERLRRDNVLCNVLCVVHDYNICCRCCTGIDRNEVSLSS